MKKIFVSPSSKKEELCFNTHMMKDYQYKVKKALLVKDLNLNQVAKVFID